MSLRDPYELLGVSPHATDAEIRRAYLRRAQEVHPDLRSVPPGSDDEFKQLRSAYEQVLKLNRAQHGPHAAHPLRHAHQSSVPSPSGDLVMMTPIDRAWRQHAITARRWQAVLLASILLAGTVTWIIHRDLTSQRAANERLVRRVVGDRRPGRDTGPAMVRSREIERAGRAEVNERGTTSKTDVNSIAQADSRSRSVPSPSPRHGEAKVSAERHDTTRRDEMPAMSAPVVPASPASAWTALPSSGQHATPWRLPDPASTVHHRSGAIDRAHLVARAMPSPTHGYPLVGATVRPPTTFRVPGARDGSSLLGPVIPPMQPNSPNWITAPGQPATPALAGPWAQLHAVLPGDPPPGSVPAWVPSLPMPSDY